jgi:hypothetical protein
MRRVLSKPRYISCLLRLWQTNDGGQYVWRASLEYPATGERLGFASLADLFIYLETELGREEDDFQRK